VAFELRAIAGMEKAMRLKRPKYQDRAEAQIEQIKSLFTGPVTSKPSEFLKEIHKLSSPPYRKGRGKAKGKGYERRVGEILGNWWQGKPFRSTPQSGGWDKQANDGDVVAYGDLYIPAGSDFPFSVECKRQECWSLEDLVNPNLVALCPILTWWDQCFNDACRVCKLPLLVFSRNNLGFDLCVTSVPSSPLNTNMRVNFGSSLDEYGWLWLNQARVLKNSLLEFVRGMHLCIMPLSVFVKTCELQPTRRTPVTRSK